MSKYHIVGNLTLRFNYICHVSVKTLVFEIGVKAQSIQYAQLHRLVKILKMRLNHALHNMCFKLKFMLDRDSLNKIYIHLYDLLLNMQVSYGTTVRNMRPMQLKEYK